MLEHFSTVCILCSAAALGGGFIDAIAGGGGLITMPVLLLSGVPPHQALACNKVSACLGTCIAIGNFARSGLVHWHMVMLGIGFSLSGSLLGTQLALQFAPDTLAKILIAMLPVGLCSVIISHHERKQAAETYTGWPLFLRLFLICLTLGVYDGFFGPGTGSFLILALHFFLHLNLMESSATSKFFNLASNLSSMALFCLNGVIIWPLAVPMAICCCLGNWLGSRMVICRGAKAVQRVLTLSLSLLLISLVWQFFFADRN